MPNQPQEALILRLYSLKTVLMNSLRYLLTFSTYVSSRMRYLKNGKFHTSLQSTKVKKINHLKTITVQSQIFLSKSIDSLKKLFLRLIYINTRFYPYLFGSSIRLFILILFTHIFSICI